MKIRELNISNYQDEIDNVIASKEDVLIYGIAPTNIVFKGKNEINEEYCREHNIVVYNSYHSGGCIVSSKGDICVGVFRKDGWKDGDAWKDFLLNYLQEKNINAYNDNNDILVDNGKVSSYGSVNLGNDYIYTGFCIDINADIELISNICTKPMNKIPKGLADYGITTQDIVDLLHSFAEENNI